MAEKKLNEIAEEIKFRWIINDISIIHRVGRLEIGDTAIVIAVGSPHRQEAFEACKYAIDTIKETVPIWKKEFYENGSSWIGHP
jgi:molybdopterin synthase catalytic subunit